MGKMRGIDQSVDSLEATKRSLINLSDELKQLLNNGLNFDDNADFYKKTHTFTTVDTEEAISHSLGRAPVHFTVVNRDAGAIIYESGTAHTDALIYLKSTATCTITMYIF